MIAEKTDEPREIDISRRLMTVKEIIEWLSGMPEEAMSLAFSTEVPPIPDDGKRKVLAFMKDSNGNITSIITKVSGTEEQIHEAEERSKQNYTIKN